MHGVACRVIDRRMKRKSTGENGRGKFSRVWASAWRAMIPAFIVLPSELCPAAPWILCQEDDAAGACWNSLVN